MGHALRLVVAVLGLLLVAGSAFAAQTGCGYYDKDDPCSTANGHYRIALPDGPAPYPAVLYLYGSLGNSGVLMRSRGFVESFTKRGYAVIVPAGLNLQYVNGNGSGWFLRNSLAKKDRDDTRFVEEVLIDAERRHRIDRKRVLIAGMSNGGFLTWEIACHAPQLGAAFAPVAAGYLGEMPAQCVKPVRILHTHGRSDKVVTVDDSGDRVSGGARIMLLEETVERIARSNGCVRQGEPEKFLDYERTTWEGCPRGGTVDLLLHDGAHTIPASWFSFVIDWFESAGNISTARGGGTAQFRSIGERPGRFRAVGQKGGRFKRASE